LTKGSEKGRILDDENDPLNWRSSGVVRGRSNGDTSGAR
jgi:hypothetical protein